MTEQQVVESVCKWLQWDPHNRTDYACYLLPHVKLALIELPYLENILLKSEFFRTCPKCQLLLSKAISAQHDGIAMQLIIPRAQPPCIYVVGGRNSTDCQLKGVERYDAVDDKWIPMVRTDKWIPMVRTDKWIPMVRTDKWIPMA
jgi:hypothetical protein